MVSMDIFRQDAFSTFQLTTAVERLPFQPNGLGLLGLFDDAPFRTRAIGIEERNGKLVLIQSSPRGAPANVERTTEKRKLRYFDAPRLRHGDTLYADEIQSVRAFGTEGELMQMQAEIARRVNGPTGLTSNLEYTMEYHRLGAVQGLLLDADGTVIYNWFDEFQVAQPAEIAFNLNPGTFVDGALRLICNQLVRSMARAAQGSFTPTTRVMGLVGDSFWDALVTHPDVTKTYYNWLAAEELRKGTAFQAFSFGGIDWFNYRGSDDNSTIKIPDTKAKFFPVGAPGVFQRALAPAEGFEWVNTPGKPVYVQPIFDLQRNEWVRFEVSSYPLHICTRPEVLFSGRQGT